MNVFAQHNTRGQPCLLVVPALLAEAGCPAICRGEGGGEGGGKETATQALWNSEGFLFFF